MSAWRHDPLSGSTVRVAPARALRPSDFSAEGSHGGCPFCAGAEHRTPPESDRIDDGDGRWLVRVVPNQYPAVDGEDGAQEVVVESPRHTSRFVELSPDEATAAVTAWARRLVHWRRDGRFDYGVVFKNEGPAAGASLAHKHSQVAALPTAPPRVAAMWQAIRRGETLPNRLLIKGTGSRQGALNPGNQAPNQRACPLFQQPVNEVPIATSAGWQIVAPTAPRFAYETWLRPHSEAPSVAELAAGQGASELAGELRRVLAAIATASGCEAFNLVFQAPPASQSAGLDRHWWLEVVPRPTSIAGLELATGLWINAVPPEVAAERLATELALLPISRRALAPG